jgi:NADH-quinone oxidoreductase subunit N
LVAGNQRGLTGIVIYIMVYAFMTMGAFFIAASLERRREISEVLVSASSEASMTAAAGGGTAVIDTAMIRSETRVARVPAEEVDDFNGLMQRNPAYALWMLLFLLSLAGIPPTSGFIGKYYIFLALIETGHYVLAVIGVLFAAVALYYYFRIVKSMFMGEGSMDESVSSQRSWGFRAAITAAGVLTIGIGMYPEPFLRLTQVFGGR